MGEGEGDVRSWVERIRQTALPAVGDLPDGLLDDYLPLLVDAAVFGVPPDKAQLSAVRAHGRQAAEAGLSAGHGIDLYLSVGRRVWEELPQPVRQRPNSEVRAAAEALLRVLTDAVAAFAQGHSDALRDIIRREETLRRELVNDLLSGDVHASSLAARAEPFGLDLTQANEVAVARPTRPLESSPLSGSLVERQILDHFGDRNALVAMRDGDVVVVRLATAGRTAVSPPTDARSSASNLAKVLYDELMRLHRGAPWQVGLGGVHVGVYGIASSFDEAREALTLASRMDIKVPIIASREVAPYRVLARHPDVLRELVVEVLSPLTTARGGPRPLIDTLLSYFANGCVSTATAAELHMSVRAVTYRVNRVATLTGYDASRPGDRYSLWTAALGARLLNWPEDDNG